MNADAAYIATQVTADSVNEEMARSVVRELGCVHTWRSMYPQEIGDYLACKGWTWADVVRRNT
jgi:hypothetical protein